MPFGHAGPIRTPAPGSRRAAGGRGSGGSGKTARVRRPGGSAPRRDRHGEGIARGRKGAEEVVREGARRQQRPVEVDAQAAVPGGRPGAQQAEAVAAVPAGGVGEDGPERTVLLDRDLERVLVPVHREGQLPAEPEPPLGPVRVRHPDVPLLGVRPERPPHHPGRVVRGGVDGREGVPRGCVRVEVPYRPEPFAADHHQPPVPERHPGVIGGAAVRAEPDLAGQRLAVDNDAVPGGGGQHHRVTVLAPLPRDGRNSPFRVVGEPVGSGQGERAVGGRDREDALLVPPPPLLGRLVRSPGLLVLLCVRAHAVNLSTPAPRGRGATAAWSRSTRSGTRRSPGGAGRPGRRSRPGLRE